MSFLDIDVDEIEALLQEPEADHAEWEGCEEVVKAGHRLSDVWYKFWSSVKSVNDPDQIWHDLCEGGAKQRQAVHLCQKFLSIYATHRKRLRVSLGPEEQKAERVVKHGRTLLNIWRLLISHFNRTVLGRKRREDPPNAAQWDLRFKEGMFTKKGLGPAYEIVRWIEAECENLGLSRNQSFEKKEATAEDIAVLLQTLWRRAEDIPCAPLSRLSFHAMLLLAASGGFRPGVVENVKYRQVSVRLICDPKTYERRLVVTITLRQNKQRRNAVKKDQRDVLEFSVVFTPYDLFCLASLVVARGLADDAFDPSFDSVEDLLQRPLMEKHIQSIDLPWKKELEDKQIFPLSYRDYWEIFNRTLLVAGYPESIRPYAVRVGAGGRLDGVLTPALRNYLLSHSSSMFERSYQPRHVRQDLLSTIAPEAHAEHTADLFQILRNSSLRCDAGAPITVSREKIDHWKQERKDMRAVLESNDYKKSAQLRVLVKKLSKAEITRQRQEYFKESNKRRVLGQATVDLHSVTPKLNASGESELQAKAIGQHFRQPEKSTDDPIYRRKVIYVEMLVAFVKGTQQTVPTCFICTGRHSLEASGKKSEAPFDSWQEVWKHTNKAHRNPKLWPFSCPECDRLGREESLDQVANISEWCSHVHEHHAPRDKAPYRCILGCQTFFDQTTLRRHLRTCHPTLWTVNEPFPCPECERLGTKECIISDNLEWRRHIELHHDPKLLPPLTQASSSTRMDHRCLLCEDQAYSTKTGLSLHNTNFHVKQGGFASPFECPECRRGGKAAIVISSLGEWCTHVTAHHGVEHAPNPPVPMDERLRCLLCDTSTHNLRKHFQTQHLKTKQFDEPFPCPECARQGVEVPHLVLSGNDWDVHCVACHAQEGSMGSQKLAGERPHTRCLICDGYYKAMSKHFTTTHAAQGLFDQPFPCPECARTDTDGNATPLIQNRDEWVIHCASVHKVVSGLPQVQSISNARKQVEMERLALTEETTTERKDMSNVSYGQQRVEKRPWGVDSEARARKRRV